MKKILPVVLLAVIIFGVGQNPLRAQHEEASEELLGEEASQDSAASFDPESLSGTWFDQTRGYGNEKKPYDVEVDGDQITIIAYAYVDGQGWVTGATCDQWKGTIDGLTIKGKYSLNSTGAHKWGMPPYPNGTYIDEHPMRGEISPDGRMIRLKNKYAQIYGGKAFKILEGEWVLVR